MKMPGRKELREKGKARLDQIKDHLADLALNAVREETQISAAIAYLNREEGLPVARAINTDVSLSELVRQSMMPDCSSS